MRIESIDFWLRKIASVPGAIRVTYFCPLLVLTSTETLCISSMATKAANESGQSGSDQGTCLWPQCPTAPSSPHPTNKNDIALTSTANRARCEDIVVLRGGIPKTAR